MRHEGASLDFDECFQIDFLLEPSDEPVDSLLTLRELVIALHVRSKNLSFGNVLVVHLTHIWRRSVDVWRPIVLTK